MKLSEGQQLFVDGVPYELIRLIDKTLAAEAWIARPLFVSCPDKMICIFESDDRRPLWEAPLKEKEAPLKGEE